MKTLFIILFTLCFVCAKAQVVFKEDDSLLTTQNHIFKPYTADSTSLYDVIGVISIKTNTNLNNHFEMDCTYTDWFGMKQSFYFTPNNITNGDSRFSYQTLPLKAGTVLQFSMHSSSTTPVLYNGSILGKRAAGSIGQRGPVGPQGVQGIAGPAGAVGPQGTAGKSSVLNVPLKGTPNYALSYAADSTLQIVPTSWTMPSPNYKNLVDTQLFQQQIVPFDGSYIVGGNITPTLLGLNSSVYLQVTYTDATLNILQTINLPAIFTIIPSNYYSQSFNAKAGTLITVTGILVGNGKYDGNSYLKNTSF